MSALTDKIAKVIGEKIFTANIDKNDLSELIKEIAVIAEAGGEPTYKVYTALLIQEGTNAPTVTILENTLGDIVWSYFGVGSYRGTLIGAFITDKTFNTITPRTTDGTFVIQRRDSNEIEIQTAINTGDVPTNELLYYTEVEVRVYN